MKAVILAAGKGTRLAPLTDDRPKPLVEVAGVPLLFRTLDRLVQAGVAEQDVLVITGYKEEVVRARLLAGGRRATTVFNPRWDEWNNFWSLKVAMDAAPGEAILQVDGDVLFDELLLPRILRAPGPACLAVDVRPHLDPETMKVQVDANGYVRAVSKKLDPQLSAGEYMGVTRLDPEVAALVHDDLSRFEPERLTHEYYEHAYHRLAQRGLGPFRLVDVHDCRTTEIDDVRDLERAEELLRTPRAQVA